MSNTEEQIRAARRQRATAMQRRDRAERAAKRAIQRVAEATADIDHADRAVAALRVVALAEVPGLAAPAPG